MMEMSGNDDARESLRKNAENDVRKRAPAEIDVSELSHEEIRAMLQELQVHQIELEMQNDELNRTKQELEASRDKYSDLYDYAPAGYFTIDRKGAIIEVNLTGANMLGLERRNLTGKPLHRFLSRNAGDSLSLYIRNAFTAVSTDCAHPVVMERTLKAQTRTTRLRPPERDQCSTDVFTAYDREHGQESEYFFLCRKDGVRLPVSISAKITELWGRKVVLCIVTDITQRKEMEEHKKSEELMRQKSQTLEEINKNLQERVHDEVERRRRQEQLLIQQSKLASMGDMISAIAHQWRQPLNAIGLIVQDIQDAYYFGELDDNYIGNSVTSSMELINFMSQTIDGFRNFFRPSKDKTTFEVKESTKKIISMFSAQLRVNYITYKLRCRIHGKSFEDPAQKCCCNEMQITTFRNEFEQVILSIINNSRDAILERRCKCPSKEFDSGVICVDFYKENGRITVAIRDNGGGIQDSIIDRIFEPYFTTKELHKGTGIGLYMAKTIIENNMGGTLSVRNIDGSGTAGESGAEFKIELNACQELNSPEFALVD
ncbi:MAG: PAS domain S-box protein [Nitrospirae bacterium]|nr:PAS domain S-box protein [Nitrospirota bacterium]